MTFTPVRQPGGIIRLPILHPDDERAPEWVRERYAGRRCVIWTEDHLGVQGSLVAGGPAPVHHPDEGPTHPVEPPPRAAFTFTPEHPVAGEPITFDASASTPAELIRRYHWQAPLEPGVEREGKVVVAAFPAGRHFAYLTVVTVDGRQHSSVRQVDVAEP